MAHTNNELNTFEDEYVKPGMLSSPQIAYYVDKYKIIKEYDEKYLGPASYHMRLGGDVLTWNDGKKIEFVLGDEEDRNKNIFRSVDLQPNSLTFLTTIEKFQLPKDIIARFNLKSKWVHQGLLLGTGPIVDPQLHAHLLIPVHNFSSDLVTMKYGEEFISVEFTKTLNPDSELRLKDDGLTKYRENKKWNFNFQKYRENIANKRVESSVQSQFQKNNEQIELSTKTISEVKKENEIAIDRIKRENDETLEKFKRFNTISLFSAAIGVIVLVVTTWSLIDSAYDKAEQAYNLVKQYESKSFDYRAFALNSTYEDLQEQFSELKRYTQHKESESYQKSEKAAADFYILQEELRMISMKIKELESRMDQKKVGKDNKDESN